MEEILLRTEGNNKFAASPANNPTTSATPTPTQKLVPTEGGAYIRSHTFCGASVAAVRLLHGAGRSESEPDRCAPEYGLRPANRDKVTSAAPLVEHPASHGPNLLRNLCPGDRAHQGSFRNTGPGEC